MMKNPSTRQGLVTLPRQAADAGSHCDSGLGHLPDRPVTRLMKPTCDSGDS
jgi:hypothetical protein